MNNTNNEQIQTATIETQTATIEFERKGNAMNNTTNTYEEILNAMTPEEILNAMIEFDQYREALRGDEELTPWEYATCGEYDSPSRIVRQIALGEAARQHGYRLWKTDSMWGVYLRFHPSPESAIAVKVVPAGYIATTEAFRKYALLPPKQA